MAHNNLHSSQMQASTWGTQIINSWESPYWPAGQDEIAAIDRLAMGRCGNYFKDYQRNGIIAVRGDGQHVFIDLLTLDEEIRKMNRPMTAMSGATGTAYLLYGTDATYDKILGPKKKVLVCSSCKGDHSSKVDSLGRCQGRLEKLWNNVRKLYWHRYAQDKKMRIVV